MLVISIVLLVVSLNAVGGFSGLEEKLSQIDPNMLKVVQDEAPDAQMSLSGVLGNFVFGVLFL